MIVRQARLEDARDICAIYNEMITNTRITFTTTLHREAGIAADIALRWDAYQVVEEDGGRIAGFATYGPFRAGPGYARTRELTIHLAEDARGRGLGRALLGRLEAVAASHGVHALVAAVSGANPGGVAFHAACGYDEVARLPEVGFKGGQWLDLILMQKILPEPETAPDSTGAAG